MIFDGGGGHRSPISEMRARAVTLNDQTNNKQIKFVREARFDYRQ
jgi:hypothetical protein